MLSKNKDIFLIFAISFVLFKFFDLIIFKNTQTINHGLFFGLFLNNLSAIILTLVLIAVLVFFAVKEKNGFLGIAIIGSAMNIFDRLFFGGVRDYLSIFSLPAFNIADSLIVLGIIFYFFSKLFNKTPP